MASKFELSKLASLFDGRLKGIEEGLDGIILGDGAIMPNNGLFAYSGDSAINDAVFKYIRELGAAVKSLAGMPLGNLKHITYKQFLELAPKLELPDCSLGSVANLALCRTLTKDFSHPDYSALRHQIRMHLIGQSYRLLKKGGVYIAVDNLPQVGGHTFRERFVAQQDGYCATLLVK